MHDEPPMPRDAEAILEWLRDPRVLARIQRDRKNAHGVDWHEMAVEAEARFRVTRQLSARRRLRALRAYIRMREGETLTALDRQALSQLARIGAALIAYANALDRPRAYGLIAEIDSAVTGSARRQERLLASLVAESAALEAGGDPATMTTDKEELDDVSLLQVSEEIRPGIVGR